MNRELFGKVEVVEHVGVDEYDATVNPDGVDLQGLDSCLFILNIGDEGVTFTTTNKIEAVLEHSDVVDSGFVAVPQDQIHTNKESVTDGKVLIFDGAIDDDDETYKVGYRGNKRFVRLNPVFGGTHGTETILGVTAVLGHPAQGPKGY